MAAHDDEQHQARATRILQVAEELLLGWGYKRVTIDDIAQRARVGKGTIYLHWKSKEALFMGLLRHELAAIMSELRREIREEPAVVLPHRLLRAMFLLHTARPLARAIFGEDTDILGALAPGKSAPSLGRALGLSAFLARILDVLRERGLMRDDRPLAEQAHALEAILMGFFLLDKLPSPEVPTREQQADVLAAVVRDAFEKPKPPGRAAVTSAARQCGEMLDELRASLLGRDE